MATVLAASPDDFDVRSVRLTFTGHGAGARLLVRIDERPVLLTIDHFDLLAVFAAKRLLTVTGRVTPTDVAATDMQHFRTKVYRLRCALDRGLGEGWGASLIRNGLAGEYRLGVPRDAIFRDGSCDELPSGVTGVDLGAFPLFSAGDGAFSPEG